MSVKSVTTRIVRTMTLLMAVGVAAADAAPANANSADAAPAPAAPKDYVIEPDDKGGSGLPSANDRSGWNVAALDVARRVDYLTELEKDVILELNMVRSNPRKYADMYIAPRIQNFNGRRYTISKNRILLTNEGAAAVEECSDELRKMVGIPLLYPSRALSLSSKDHVDDTGPAGLIGHTGADGSTLRQRVERHGKWVGAIGENIAYGIASGRDIVVGLLVDDGVPDRGHRITIMDKDYKYVGVSVGYHSLYKTMCVQNFAGGITDAPTARSASAAAAAPQPPAPASAPSHDAPPAADAIVVNRKDGSVEFELGGINVRVGTLVVYDSNGKSVKRVPVSGTTVRWDLTDTRGRQVPAGVYVIEGTVTSARGKRHNASVKIDVR